MRNKKGDYKYGIILSLMAYMFQLIFIQISGLKYLCVGLVYVLIYIRFPFTIGINPGFLSNYMLSFSSNEPSFVVGINIIALVILGLLNRAYNKLYLKQSN